MASLPLRLSLKNVDFFGENFSPKSGSMPVNPEVSGWKPDHLSYVAYSLADIKEVMESGNLRIKVRLKAHSQVPRVQIRTVAFHPADQLLGVRDFMQTGVGKIAAKNSKAMELLSVLLPHQEYEPFPGREVLGNVKPSTIYFAENGYSIFLGVHTLVPVNLEKTLFQNMGVGIYDINWQWEFRMLDEKKTTEDEDVWEENWRPFAVTRHRLFVTLDSPRFPWTSQPSPDYTAGFPYAVPPRADALMIACDWAAGSTSKEEAAAKITNRLFESQRFYYNVNSSYFREEPVTYPGNLTEGNEAGAQHPVLHHFYFSKVLERLRGGSGMGNNANCVDCALTVTAFSNLLGCNLRVGKMQNTDDFTPGEADFVEKNRFEVNPLCAIGHKGPEESMPGLENKGKYYFSYHAVAWQGKDDSDISPEGKFDDPAVRIYDACVRFPSENGYIPAAGLTLGTGENENDYRARLATHTDLGVPRCKAQPATVIHSQLV